MKRRLTMVLTLVFVIVAAVRLDAQIYDRNPQKKENLYKDLPAEKDFDMGALKDSFNMHLALTRDLMKSSKILIKERYHQCNFFARRMEFYAGHPYFEKATGIRKEWVTRVAAGLRFISGLLSERERAEMFSRTEEVKKEEASLEEARAKFEIYLKTPEKIEKPEQKQ